MINNKHGNRLDAINGMRIALRHSIDPIILNLDIETETQK